jgi:signal transduction histidine kinase
LLASPRGLSALRRACWPLIVGFGVVAEAVGRPELIVLDGTVGFALAGLGLIAWSRRTTSWTGPLLVLSGAAWFLGTIDDDFLYLHRGVLAHAVLVHPGKKFLPASWLERAAVVAAYVYSGWYPLGHDDRAALVFAGALAVLAIRRVAVARGLDRRARQTAFAAGAVFGGACAYASLARLLTLGVSGSATLAVYDIAVAASGGLLGGDLLVGRRSQGAVTGVVIDLGRRGVRSLTASLARTVGDPSLEVGYWLPERDAYVDESGHRLHLEADGRTVTTVDDRGAPLATVVHDDAVLDDPQLLSGVAAAVRLAVSNVRLQSDVVARAAEVEASRRRIVEAADEQRRRLERELREGAARRLGRVAALVEDDAALSAQLAALQEELLELARGIHPGSLVDGGLAAAVAELAARSPVPVKLSTTPVRFEPAIEAAAYFVCSEALANAVKHANAARVHVRIEQRDARLSVVVEDDGVGGADPVRGSGLRGLADRLEAVGGRLRVESSVGRGTRVLGELPVEGGA